MKFPVKTLLAALLGAIGLNASAQISDGIVKIGVPGIGGCRQNGC